MLRNEQKLFICWKYIYVIYYSGYVYAAVIIFKTVLALGCLIPVHWPCLCLFHSILIRKALKQDVPCMTKRFNTADIEDV